MADVSETTPVPSEAGPQAVAVLTVGKGYFPEGVEKSSW